MFGFAAIMFLVKNHPLLSMKIIRLRLTPRESDLLSIVEGCKKKDKRSQEMLFKHLAPKILTTCRRYESTHFGAPGHFTGNVHNRI